MGRKVKKHQIWCIEENGAPTSIRECSAKDVRLVALALCGEVGEDGKRRFPRGLIYDDGTTLHSVRYTRSGFEEERLDLRSPPRLRQGEAVGWVEVARKLPPMREWVLLYFEGDGKVGRAVDGFWRPGNRAGEPASVAWYVEDGEQLPEPPTKWMRRPWVSWIACDDALPEPGDPVWVRGQSGAIVTACLQVTDGSASWVRRGRIIEKPTAWTPLPSVQ